MKCEGFAAWLENRDTYDVSEADRAHRHAAECRRCEQLLKKDELLDRFITESLAVEPMPESLKKRIDLNIERQVPVRTSKRLLAAVSMVCFVIIAIFTFSPSKEQFVTMDEMGTFMVTDHRDHGQVQTIFEPVTDAALWLVANNVRNVAPPLQLIEGYSVKGARFCHLGHCRAVHMLYAKGGEFVSVFVVDDSEIDFHLEEGRVYTLAMDGNWVKLCKQNNQVFALVT
jgi:hypothetical protein